MLNRNVMGCVVLVAFLVVGGCERKAGVSYTPTNHTDENWVNGVAKTWATAFFVAGSVQAKSDLAVGKKVTFSDGTVRRIVQLKESDGSLMVFLDGSPLDGKIVGHPKKIEVTDATSVSYTPTNYTDDNWVNGIARTWAAAFFVTDSILAKTDFAVGKKVTFSDGTVRTIVEQKENAGGLIVFLDGTPLDGNVVGYPKEIKVTGATK